MLTSSLRSCRADIKWFHFKCQKLVVTAFNNRLLKNSKKHVPLCCVYHGTQSFKKRLLPCAEKCYGLKTNRTYELADLFSYRLRITRTRTIPIPCQICNHRALWKMPYGEMLAPCVFVIAGVSTLEALFPVPAFAITMRLFRQKFSLPTSSRGNCNSDII